MLPSSLQVSIVTYRPDRVLLDRTLRKLAQAIAVAREAGAIRTVHVALIDNSGDRDNAEAVKNMGHARFAEAAADEHRRPVADRAADGIHRERGLPGFGQGAIKAGSDVVERIEQRPVQIVNQQAHAVQLAVVHGIALSDS